MKPALLFYCQHSVGLGHLMRSYALCARRSPSASASCCSPAATCPTGIDPPRGVELVALPPLGVQTDGFGARDRRPRPHVGAPRTAASCMTLGRVQPSVVLVELFPFGRAKFARELVPLLEEARAMGAFTACSLRDILVSGEPARARRPRGSARRRLLDAVLVHCDPRFARLEETFKPSTPLDRPRPLHRLRHRRQRHQRPPPRRAHRRLRGRRARRLRRCSRRRWTPRTAARCARSPAR